MAPKKIATMIPTQEGPNAMAPPAADDGVMTMVIRTRKSVQFRRYSDTAYFSTRLGDVIDEDGDFSECGLAFSQDGELMACSNAARVFVVECDTARVRIKIDEPRVTATQFSNNGKILITIRPQDTRKTGDGNMTFWQLDAGAAVELLRCGQSTWPAVWFASDGVHLIRGVQGHLLQLHDATLVDRKPLATVDLQTPRGKDPVVAVYPGSLPLVGVFVPQIKNSPGSVKIFRLPNLSEDLLSRTVGNADQATLLWSPHCPALLIVTQSDTDKTGGSYYGRGSLTLFNVTERKIVTVLPQGKDDHIHDAAWSPTADEFIVVHGQMPHNKATLYNAKAEAIFNFGESPRNYIRWSPNGKLFILGGNGNLAGEVQFFDREHVGDKNKDAKLGFFSEKTSIQLWTPDSRSVISANVFPRLRLDNGYTLWKHTGAKLAVEKFDEMYEITFVPVDHSRFRVRPPSPVVQNSEAAKPQAYRPPGGASAAAAALLARQPAAAVGHAAKPAGPVGAVLLEKKKRR